MRGADLTANLIPEQSASGGSEVPYDDTAVLAAIAAIQGDVTTLQTDVVAAAPKAWQAWTAVVKGTVSDPVRATGDSLVAYYRHEGYTLDLRFDYRRPTAVTAGGVGSGTYYIPIPTGLTIDVAKSPAHTTTGRPVSGFMDQWIDGVVHQWGGVVVHDTTAIGIVYNADGNLQVMTAVNGRWNHGNGISLGFFCQIPVLELAP